MHVGVPFSVTRGAPNLRARYPNPAPSFPGFSGFLKGYEPHIGEFWPQVITEAKRRMASEGMQFNWSVEARGAMELNGKQVEQPLIQRMSMLNGTGGIIAPARARRALAPTGKTQAHVENCVLCPPDLFIKTPLFDPTTQGAFNRLTKHWLTQAELVDGRIFHQAFKGPELGGSRQAGRAVSVPNLNMFSPMHVVTVYPGCENGTGTGTVGHKLNLSQFWFDDVRHFIHSEYDLALLHMELGYATFADITNWHEPAGASLQHPHSQRFTLDTLMPGNHGPLGILDVRNLQADSLARAKAFHDLYGVNMFDFFIHEEESESPENSRVIFSNEDVLICVPFSATSNFEVWVVPKRRIANIVDTTFDERDALIQPLTGVFPALYFFGSASEAGEKVCSSGINSLNIAVYMAPFHDSDAPDYYRWHMVIRPRRETVTSDRAGAEIGYDMYPISTAPENAAAVLRQWFVGPYRGADDPRLRLIGANGESAYAKPQDYSAALASAERLRVQAIQCLESRFFEV